MTVVYADPLFQRHDTGSHPESPARLASIDRRLSAAGLMEGSESAHAVAMEDVQAVHASEVIAKAREMAKTGGGYLDPDTVLSPESFEVALKAAGTAAHAVDEVLEGRHDRALCLIRPPGHHATPTRSMGFCLFNNVAVAAKRALTKHGLDRILIVDWDVHHGNGTQDVFYDVENVVFFSSHRFPFYPGSGAADETGTGAGLGSTFNLPVAFGTSRQDFLTAFEATLHKAAEKARPDLILISAGFDAHAADPIGSLGLETEDFGALTRMVVDVAESTCQGRIVSCLEGGYDRDALAASVETHLRGLRRGE